MAAHRNREEAVNTQLAILISRLGVQADAETIHVHGTERPDVLFQMRGLRVVIEGKFSDHPTAKTVVLDDARGRVTRGLAHVAAAVVYPRTLRTTRTAQILDNLANSSLKYCIVSETGESEWFEGPPSALMEALRHAQEALTQNDIVDRTAKSLSTTLHGVAQLWIGNEGACDRLSNILGITPPKSESGEKALDRRETSAKVAALVLANAFIFQDQLAATDGRISSLHKLRNERDAISAAQSHWRWIWENIDYVPIFQIGERILQELPMSANSLGAVRSLLAEATSICNEQTALRHDLMGRIYHWLLHEAKYLGTYYTSVSAATLLLKLALAASWNKDLSDPVELASFKVADLACGTGTLLMAAAHAISDTYIRTRADAGRSLTRVDLQTLHRALMENVLHGYDVLPSAVHLTASTLALLAPEVAFVRMNLFVMPLGMDGNTPRLGSLDFLESRKLTTQMSLDYSHAETIRTGASASYVVNASVPELDLCVMNPPFTRSVGGNLLFGSLPDERGRLQAELRKWVKHLPANSTAGLGSVFVALGDKLLKENGRLAFVLPAAVVSGEAWARTRELIAERYHLEIVVASHDAEYPNFSENTDLSEVLFIARKRPGKELPGRTTYINLWWNPRSLHEALDLANRITSLDTITTVEAQGLTSIRSASAKLGEVITMPVAVGGSNWTGALFAQSELLRACWSLEQGQLLFPGQQETHAIPMCRVVDLGELGPDRRRVHEGFKHSVDDPTPYPSFWNHDSDAVRTIRQVPNRHLQVWHESPRGPDSGPHLWQRAGTLLLAERLRLNTQRLVAIRLDCPVLSNTWWPLKTRDFSADQEKVLLMWLNSTLALLLCFARRVITEGAFVSLKQPAWATMPVLDVRYLPKNQLAALAKAYDHVSEKSLEPLGQLNIDATRQTIDAALGAALGLPDLAHLRTLFAREPGLTAQSISAISHS